MTRNEVDDELDGCELIGRDARLWPWPDDELDTFALFADIDANDFGAVGERASEWLELFP
jgi:hypothetical protein